MTGSILVVDDNPATLYSTSHVLKGEGWNIVQAMSGTEALALAIESFEAIILDVHLPDMSGFDISKQVRQIKGCATIPIIHLSATYVSDDDKITGLDSGADAYLTHPVDPRVLVATVNAFLRARKAEEAQRSINAKFRAIFDQNVSYSAILSLKGDLNEVNRAALDKCGYTREDVIGKPFWQTGWWSGSEETQRMVEKAFLLALDGRFIAEELPCWMADGTQRIVDFQLTPVIDEADEAIFVAATWTDITYRKRTEAENALLFHSLEETDRKKDEFLATLAHELRNPLAPLRNGLEVLRLTGGNEQSLPLLEVMNRQLNQLVRLVDDLLDVSRITRGKVDLQIQSLDLKQVLETALETSLPMIEEKGHDLTTHFANDEIVVDADLIRLSQVFTNILNNAARYTPNGGRISITADLVDGFAEIKVQDTGIGIERGKLKEVFDLFAQVEENRIQGSDGLGLGLTLVKDLVGLHGGSVWAESEGLGHGTTFTVHLPASVDRADPARVKLSSLGKDGRRIKILVVDDSVDNANLLTRIIELADHEVRTVHRGEDAIRVTEEFAPDLAFVDIGLPDMTGRDVARQIRQRLGRAITLIALTGYGTPADQELSREAGFDSHLTKPASLAELYRIIESATLV